MPAVKVALYTFAAFTMLLYMGKEQTYSRQWFEKHSRPETYTCSATFQLENHDPKLIHCGGTTCLRLVVYETNN